MSEAVSQIAENVAQIRGRIAAAAERSGRAAGDVTLVAVTKFIPAEVVRLLVEAGCHDLGESRPQELWQKAATLADLPVRWHLIGHLQRNKVRRTLPLVAMIHSIDSPQLLAAVNEESHGGADIPVCPDAAAFSGKLPVLLEVNVSGEAAKHGFSPAEIEPLLADLAVYRNVTIRGLMCMAVLEGGPDVARRDFAALRELRDRVRDRCSPGHALDELSMGMSGDFEQAIEEGATIVRVGSALFEGVAGSG
jgi:pyridoxal phosphate enzyme (YggS family)